MRRAPSCLAVLALLTVASVVPSPAVAATPTPVGEVAPPTFGVSCLGQATLVQETSRPGATSFDMPFDGVITSFSTRTNVANATARMFLFSQVNPTTFQVMALSDTFPTLNAVVNTYAVRVPVKAGWKLGANLSGGCGQATSGTDDLNSISGAVTAPGQVVTGATVGPGYRLNLAAQLEPDVDGDGYGDLSQDACPESGLAVVACPAPETTITKAPKSRSRNRAVVVAFTSSAPRSTFLVSVDGKAAVEVLSPYRKTLKPGKHTVTVQAVSPLGVADPTPATSTFTIKKPRKSH